MSAWRSVLRTRRGDILGCLATAFGLVAAHTLLRTIGQMTLPLLALAAPFLFFAAVSRSRESMAAGQLVSFFAAVTLAGIIMFIPAVAVVAGTGLGAMSLAWLAAKRSVTGLAYERTLSQTRVFPGDALELVVRIANPKLFPLSWFDIADPIHIRGGSSKNRLGRLLDVSAPVESVEQHVMGIVQRGSVGSYQALERRVGITALHRGVFAFGPARLESGDPFGFFTSRAESGGRSELIVYPRPAAIQSIEPAFWDAMGTFATRNKLFEDPSLLAGSREYHPDDPLRHIHWNATARTGDLQVRIHDPATTTHVMIVLNLDTYVHVWEGVDPERMEATIEVAAAIAMSCVDRGFLVGIESNGVLAESSTPSRMPPAASPRQASMLLEYLARLSYSGAHSPDDMLQREARRQARTTSVIFVTPVMTHSIQQALTGPGLRNRACVVYCGRSAAPLVPGLPVYLANPKGNWSDDRAVS